MTPSPWQLYLHSTLMGSKADDKKRRLLEPIKDFGVLPCFSHGTQSLTPETHQTNTTLFQGFRESFVVIIFEVHWAQVQLGGGGVKD